MDKLRFIYCLYYIIKKKPHAVIWKTDDACMSVTDENVIQHEASGGSISAAHYSEYLG